MKFGQFLFCRKTFIKKSIHDINMKQNQLVKISFVRPVTLNTRKSDDFRELYENEPEMAALGVERIISICDAIFGELTLN